VILEAQPKHGAGIVGGALAWPLGKGQKITGACFDEHTASVWYIERATRRRLARDAERPLPMVL